MNATDDHSDDMDLSRVIDDRTADAIVAGRATSDPAVAPLTDLVVEMRMLARQPAPPPSAALAAILAGGVVDDATDPRRAGQSPAPSGVGARRARPSARNRFGRLGRNLAGVGLAAKIVLGTGVAAAGVTGAAAAGVLPDRVEGVVAGVVDAVTPFELPRHADTRPKHVPSAPGPDEAPPSGPGQGGVDRRSGPASGESPDRDTPNAPVTAGPRGTLPSSSTGPADPGVPATTRPSTPGPSSAPTAGTEPARASVPGERTGDPAPASPADPTSTSRSGDTPVPIGSAPAGPGPAGTPPGAETGAPGAASGPGTATGGTTSGANPATDAPSSETAGSDPLAPAVPSSGGRR